MIQRQSNNRRCGRAHNHQGPEFIVFSDVKGIVHREFVPPNTTVNADFYSYCDILRHLRENVGRKRLEFWRNHNWLLHHDNAPANMSLKTIEFVTNNNTVIVPPPSYAPD
jgi:hypothetical protein